MNEPLVSVIIPNYCHARYLDQRILSVLNQTYSNFEVILLDDKSSDNSVEVMRRYQDNPHVSHIIVNEKNSGSTFLQWDKGFSLAKGEYIWIAESDDYCEKNLMSELMNTLINNNQCVFAFSPVVMVDDEKPYYYPISGDNYILEGTDFLKNYMFYGNTVLNASCCIFKKSVLDDIEGLYKNLRGAGDYMFWTEMAMKGSVSVVRKYLSYWRRHEGVVTGKRDSDGSNFVDDKVVVDFIKNNVPCTDTHYIYACNNRFFRMNNVSFDSEKIKRHVYEIWNVTGNEDVYKSQDSKDYLSWEINARLSIAKFRLANMKFEIEDRKTIIDASLNMMRKISFPLYLLFLVKETSMLGFDYAKADHSYVCSMRSVEENPLLRLRNAAIVRLGQLRRAMR